jgi:DNA-3-methyladenine glycosylase
MPDDARSLTSSRLPASFYLRPAREVAPDLIGRVLVHRVDGVRLAARILETEAYEGPVDLASHAARGRTARTEPMFWRGGHAYIYLVYGMYHCFNVVVAGEGIPHAVLIRAVEPLQGIDAMRAVAPRCRPADLGRGPGRLARSMRLDLTRNRSNLLDGPVTLEEGRPPARRQIARGERIGVDYAGPWARRPWRFGWRGHPGLSRPL